MKKPGRRLSKGSSTKSRPNLTRDINHAVKAVDDFVKSKCAPKAKKDVVDLIRELYKAVYRETESFEKKNIGADLAYLVGAIVNDNLCLWPPDEPLLHLLTKNFPKEHQLWKYLAIEE